MYNAIEDPFNKTTIIKLLQILRKINEVQKLEDKSKIKEQFDKLGATNQIM